MSNGGKDKNNFFVLVRLYQKAVKPIMLNLFFKETIKLERVSSIDGEEINLIQSF